jgi:antitoxin HicB
MSNLWSEEPIDYPVTVRETVRHGEKWYMASHPDLPGCQSDGSTPEEAIADLEDARSQYIESLREDGIEVPAPYSSYATTLGTTGNPSEARTGVIPIRARIGARSGALEKSATPGLLTVAV